MYMDRIHNHEVAGSIPAPATKSKRLRIKDLKDLILPSPFSFCLYLFTSFLSFRHETSYETIGDSWAYPDFRQHIVGIFVDGFQIDVVVVECGNDYVDDADSQ